jgi:hypothetical protein
MKRFKEYIKNLLKKESVMWIEVPMVCKSLKAKQDIMLAIMETLEQQIKIDKEYE